jgi:hypothetical protein
MSWWLGPTRQTWGALVSMTVKHVIARMWTSKRGVAAGHRLPHHTLEYVYGLAGVVGTA